MSNKLSPQEETTTAIEAVSVVVEENTAVAQFRVDELAVAQ